MSTLDATDVADLEGQAGQPEPGTPNREWKPALLLGAIVVIAAGVHALIALGRPAPLVIPDELIYSELAKSMGGGGLPSVRGETYLERGVAYPALLAPMWAIFGEITHAYAAAKILNAVVMSLTAIPAFFLARRFVATDAALGVAALSVAVPSLLYSGMLLTEVALYPAFVLAVLAIDAALDRPTRSLQLAALASISLAFLIKPVAAVLLAVYPASILIRRWLEGRSTDRRGRVGAYATTWWSIGIVGLAAIVLPIATGRSPQAAFGTYRSVIDHADVREIPHWILAHAGELVLAVAVIPFAATLAVVVRGVRRHAHTVDLRFAALVAPVVVLWLVAVGAYASVPFLEEFEYPAHGGRMQGRATFMLAPLFFLGLAIWLPRRLVGRATLVAVVATTIALPAFIPLHSGLNAYFQDLPLVIWDGLRGSMWWPLAGVVFAGALAGLWALAVQRPVRSAVVLAPIVVVLGAMTGIASGAIQWNSDGSRESGAGESVTWVDDAVPKGQPVSVLWAESGTARFVGQKARQQIVFVGEFFNRSIGDVYELGPSLPYALPATRVRLSRGLVVDSGGRAVDPGPFVMAPCYVRVEGRVIARDERTGAAVYRVDVPFRAQVAAPSSCPRAGGA